MLFGTALVNSYLIYKENYTASKVSILQFRESLVRSLLLGIPFEYFEPGPRKQSTQNSKRKLADHKLEEIEGPTSNVQRRCAGCYEKIRKQESREASAMAAKRIKNFCPDCDEFFCLDCFNEKNFSK